jgi:hypothetical protein
VQPESPDEGREKESADVNERALRVEFFVAVAALLVSALTAGTLIYQTRVIGNQYAATIWPYLALTSTYGLNGEKIELVNEGLGPALIDSAELFVDGKPSSTWGPYLEALFNEPEFRNVILRARSQQALAQQMTASTETIGPSSTIRPGASQMLLSFSYKQTLPISVLQRHQLTFTICYCSLNGSCWRLHGTAGQDTRQSPEPLAHCTNNAEIGSNGMSIRIHRPKK